MCCNAPDELTLITRVSGRGLFGAAHFVMGRTGRCQLISSSCLGWQCGRPWSLPTRAPASQHLLRLAVADTPRRDRAHGGPARGRAVGHRRPLRTVVRPGLFAALRSIKSTPPPRGWRQTPNPVYYLGLQPLGLSEMAKQTTRPGAVLLSY